MSPREIREKRGKILKRARDIIDKAEADKRAMSPEEDANFEAAHKEADRLYDQATKIEAQEEREKDQAESEERARIEAHKRVNLEPEDRAAVHGKAFRKWMTTGMDGLDHEERSVMIESRGTGDQTTTAAEGGYTIPEDFSGELEKALLAYGGVRSVARVIKTSSGAALPWPTVNDTGVSGAILAEADADAVSDMTFAAVTLNAYTYTSGIVKVSMELLQDSGVNLEAELASLMATRLFRGTNAHFTTGTGSSQPNGCVTAATDSTIDLSMADNWGAGNLMGIYHALDPDYRTNASWMLHDTAVLEIKKIQNFTSGGTDTWRGGWLWQPGLTAGEPNTIMGKPYVVNQAMADANTNLNICILFGDFSKYIIRDVLGIQMIRMDERYAEYLHVGFNVFSRHDADLIDAGTNPIVSANVVTGS